MIPAEAVAKITHHFGAGVYMKATEIPAGVKLAQHRHKHDHLSVLCRGVAFVTVDGQRTHHIGPKVLTIEAGKVHTVEAMTDVTWLCVHAIDETDPERVDMQLIEGA